MDDPVRRELFSNGSCAIQVQEKSDRMERSRLAQQCAKLDPEFERAIADEGLAEDLELGQNIEGWYSLGRPQRGQGKRAAGRATGARHQPRCFNERSPTVIVVAPTSQEQKAGFPLTHELLLTKLPKRPGVKMSRVSTLSTARIGKKQGVVQPEELDRVVDGSNEIIG